VINSFVVAWVLVVGFGFGGWASITNFVQQVNTFGLFAKRYQCPPHLACPPPPMAPAPAMPPATVFNATGFFPPVPAPAPAPSPMMNFFLRHHRHRHHGRHGL